MGPSKAVMPTAPFDPTVRAGRLGGAEKQDNKESPQAGARLRKHARNRAERETLILVKPY